MGLLHHPFWLQLVVPALWQKRGILKLIRPSVTKTFTWLISSEVLMMVHWYLACMILVSSSSHWHHAVTLTFVLFKVTFAGDHNSPNLLVLALFGPYFSTFYTKCLAEDHWRGFTTRNAHMVHIVNLIRLKWCIHLSRSLYLNISGLAT